MNVPTLDIKGRLIAQEVYSELEKIARFTINNIDDLRSARKTVADFTKMVNAEPKPRTFRLSPSDMKGSRRKSLEKELTKMQNDLRDAEVEFRDRGVGAMKRYARDPEGYAGSPDETDINKVKDILKEVNTNRTKKRGMFFKNDVKVKEPKKQAPIEEVKEAPKQGLMDRTAKKIGYGAMLGLGGYGGVKMYQNKKQNDMYGGGY